MSLRDAPDAARRMLAVEASTYTEPNVAAIRSNTCPCCGTVGKFRAGPSGGMSTNYECICGSRLNITSGFGGPFRCDILFDSPEAQKMRAEAFRLEQERVAEDHARRAARSRAFWKGVGWAIGYFAGLAALLVVIYLVRR